MNTWDKSSLNSTKLLFKTVLRQFLLHFTSSLFYTNSSLGLRVSHCSPDLTGRKTEAQSWEVSKAKHCARNQVRITVLEQLQSRLLLDSRYAKQHFHSQEGLCSENKFARSCTFESSEFLSIDTDGLTLGDKHPGPDLRHYLSTYTKETNEQTNNIF